MIISFRYNNITYRIDDIDWKTNPTHIFSARGENVSYVEYYNSHYNIRIKIPQQPMLISSHRDTDHHSSGTGPILLVPELCSIVGLSEEAAADVSMMEDISVLTKVPPQERHNTLTEFMHDIYRLLSSIHLIHIHYYIYLNRYNIKLSYVKGLSYQGL